MCLVSDACYSGSVAEEGELTLAWRKGAERMRRVALVLAATALALLLASGVAWAVNKIGTDGPDTLRGTNGADNLLGKGGNDRLFGLRGRDTLLGGPGKDWVDTHPKEYRTGDKNLLGGPGNDIVFGGWGSDKMVGEEGNDLLADSPTREVASDIVTGGAGTDVIPVASLRLRASAEDIVTCGSGFDRALADTKDVVAPDCEEVVLFRGGSASEYFDLVDEFLADVPPSFFEGLQPGVLQDG
jgi:Ca2+-binding RTX toxin-like protein